ncbi:MAG: TetR family transcriptional regulator [Gordonia sp.]|uniref:TetR/AcrR family transcriptional regulator n=1 Tax=Gordonia sp. (in: high G+C Gram-positive bacteria) TaxID=84139 RepID=UPI000C64E393|nr:TetR/AcrR family transcriptional regulator [Gordonia sp. (in: high G+C Gram-positive bacteria)]MAU82934.1 TetR family transcriptional regulator [Gordonia sp. (in: high G+C Gram-positive bacteria)]
MTTRGRRYGGADAAQRRDRRRSDLIAAGLELFGTEGFATVSVKRICDHAGLTQRYFYESFEDRFALLAAVYEDCVATARAATIGAGAPFVGGSGGAVSEGESAKSVGILATDAEAVARAALGAFIGTLADQPRRARVMLVEVVGVNPALERLRLTAIHGWADLILELALGERSAARPQRLAAIGLVGAVTQLLVDWYTSTAGEFAPGDATDADLFELDAILDVSVELFVAAYQRLLG